MNEHIISFLKKASEDTELQEKFKTVTDPDEAYALAASIQEGFTKDEFIEAMTKIKEQLDSTGELTDEDLAKAAGGLTEEDRNFIPVGIFMGSTLGLVTGIVAS